MAETRILLGSATLSNSRGTPVIQRPSTINNCRLTANRVNGPLSIAVSQRPTVAHHQPPTVTARLPPEPFRAGP